MQPQQSTDAAKEQRLLAKRDQKRAALLQDFATAQKTARRQLKEVEGPRMRDQIQHKVLLISTKRESCLHSATHV